MRHVRSQEETVAIRQAAAESLERAMYVMQLWHERKLGARRLLIRQGRKKFGPPTPEHEKILNEVNDLDHLGTLAEKLLDISTWDELLAGA